MKIKAVALLLVSLFLLASGCDKAQEELVVTGTPDDPVVMVDSNDPEMKAAVAKARKTVDEFLAAMENPKPEQESFAVKKMFTQGETKEYMWLSGLTYENGMFTGELNNDPVLVDNVKIGETFSVSKEEIFDWMYFEGEEIVGGHSVKLLMDRAKKAGKF